MKRKFKSNIKEIDDTIDFLVNKYFNNGNANVISEMFTAVAKLGLESSDRGDLGLLNVNIKELRYAFGLFSKYRNVRKVAIFGSARTKNNAAQYQTAEEFARKIVQKGYMVITGGGGGIMEAGNKGAGKDSSFGINIRLPFEQFANPYISGPRLVNFKYFFTRKLIFQKESDATVLLPGGFGTIDEGMEVLTLVQTGKSKPRPVILLAPEGDDYWIRFNNVIKNKMLADGYISKEDLSLFSLSSNTDDTVEKIVNFYKTYHSIRFVGDKTVLRFNYHVHEDVIKEVNLHFKDIIVEGSIIESPALDDEVRDDDHPDLFRLVFRFNRRNFGRLIELIHLINERNENK